MAHSEQAGARAANRGFGSSNIARIERCVGDQLAPQPNDERFAQGCRANHADTLTALHSMAMYKHVKNEVADSGANTT